MRSATGREDEGDFRIYDTVDEIKSSTLVGARRKRMHHNPQNRVYPPQAMADKFVGDLLGQERDSGGIINS
jgi:hypothetical protein